MTAPAALWAAGAAFIVAILILLRRPLALVWRLLLRSGVGLCALWLLDQAGALIGVRLGVNLLGALVLGLLGVPGLGLLLMAQWLLR